MPNAAIVYAEVKIGINEIKYSCGFPIYSTIYGRTAAGHFSRGISETTRCSDHLNELHASVYFSFIPLKQSSCYQQCFARGSLRAFVHEIETFCCVILVCVPLAALIRGATPLVSRSL